MLPFRHVSKYCFEIPDLFLLLQISGRITLEELIRHESSRRYIATKLFDEVFKNRLQLLWYFYCTMASLMDIGLADKRFRVSKKRCHRKVERERERERARVSKNNVSKLPKERKWRDTRKTNVPKHQTKQEAGVSHYTTYQVGPMPVTFSKPVNGHDVSSLVCGETKLR